MTLEHLIIRGIEQKDADAIWEIAHEVVKTGDTWVISPDTTKTEMLAYWLDAKKYTYVAEIEGKVVGMFFMTDNQKGLGSHIANAGYMVHPNLQIKGIGRKMGEFSLIEAQRLGYKAMQFNVVVKTNEKAIYLWQSLGFQIIGEIPEAFQHSQLGLVNAYIMYKKL
jgi:ribosomal protein S18 acetylase RimI-like enzyme